MRLMNNYFFTFSTFSFLINKPDKEIDGGIVFVIHCH